MANPAARLRNLLEPPGLVEHFRAHPPLGFRALATPAGAPAFLVRFDLLTTADASLRRRVERLPLHRWWGRLLRPRTAFVGTTVTEYAPLPAGADAAALASEWRSLGRRHPFAIVKDIPQDSPLLDAESNRLAREVAAACEGAGFVLVEGQALAWVPIDFDSEAEYLARLSGSRRKDIRRKLRGRAALEIEEVRTGDPRFADPRVRAAFHALYLAVYDQSELHFDQLSPAFLDAVLQDASLDGIVFVYRHAGRMIGWNLCFRAGALLVDKYIGLEYPAAREHNLYFVSWMHNLAWARRHELEAFVAGWTDPEIKAQLGARFTFTRHAVRPRSRVLRALLRRLAHRFESDRAWAEARAGRAGAGDAAGRP
jgi:hypothetical protein